MSLIMRLWLIIRSVGQGGVSHYGTWKAVESQKSRSVDPSEPRVLLDAVGRWMAALGPLVLGAWPGRPSTKAGNG